MLALWIILGIVGIVLLYLIIVYNGLIRLKNKVENAWAQIDVQLKRRTDLIPNLMESVKGYMAHEKGVLENVTKARSALLNAGTLEDKFDASNQLTNALKSLFAVSENYPNLKANQNFLQLQQELTNTEDKIAYARQIYNDMVMIFNTKIQVFPNNLFANLLNFTKLPLFKTEGAERENVKVKF